LLILDTGSGGPPASDCWRFPMSCVSIAKSLNDKIFDISTETVDNLMERVKYILVEYPGSCIKFYFWPTGSSDKCYGGIKNWFLYYPSL